eukprot:CAMPEP_0202469392 /NCGR_PEP_ID=MMETSP1360-20130828/78387_1 /ASSEMBLY_ACC=CAM_ASM_000848 /TAXON_ID=515479 /ORGANISM="Licmophora paradoxa, Strain CCMP2313" /LENGTH=71 /DNA_ID=CAMNT_0049094727 /DNA_START=14 /DNA_END=225 /DNA_ORIENTATION=-
MNDHYLRIVSPERKRRCIRAIPMIMGFCALTSFLIVTSGNGDHREGASAPMCTPKKGCTDTAPPTAAPSIL